MTSHTNRGSDLYGMLTRLENPAIDSRFSHFEFQRIQLDPLKRDRPSRSNLPFYEVLSKAFGANAETDSHSSPSKVTLYIAFDTNILKIMGIPGNQFLTTTDSLAKSREDLAKENIDLGFLVPGQTYLEYFNNADAFHANSTDKYVNKLKQLKDSLQSEEIAELNGAGILDFDSLNELEQQLDKAIALTHDERNKSRMGASTSLWTTLLEEWGGILGTVPRDKLYTIAQLRGSGKIPPGWNDLDKKGLTGYGDFYLWADCLMLLRQLNLDEGKDGYFIFVSDDGTSTKKSDWGPNGSFHPFLVKECFELTGFRAFKITAKEYRTLAEFLSNA